MINIIIIMMMIIIMIIIIIIVIIMIIIMALAAAHILSVLRHCFWLAIQDERTNERFTYGLYSAWRIGASFPISDERLSCSTDLAHGF